MNLSKGNLAGAHFDHADFNQAKILGSHFNKANLNSAYFNGAQLKGSSFDLTDFTGVTMLRADISGANLEYAANLTCEQLFTAKLFDRKSTVIPIYLKVEWKSEEEFTCKRDLCVDLGDDLGDINKRMVAKACN